MWTKSVFFKGIVVNYIYKKHYHDINIVIWEMIFFIFPGRPISLGWIKYIVIDSISSRTDAF